MNDYQKQEWEKIVKEAQNSLQSDCPLIEDEVIVAVHKDMGAMRALIHYIANDWIELSHDKVRFQRDDYVRLAKKVLNEIN